MLDSVSFGDVRERSGGDCIVFYPSSTDSIWDVAKKYSTTVAELVETNKLTVSQSPDDTSTLDGIKYLII